MIDGEDRTTASLLAGYVQKQLKRFDKSLSASQETGDVEAVHDVRVASRRLAEPLRLMGKGLGRKRVQRECRLLRRTRGALRQVRDLDVLQTAMMESHAGGILEPTDLAHVEGVLTQRREKTLSKARRRWAQFRPEKLISRVNDLADEYASAVQEDLDEALAQQVRRLFQQRAERLLSRDPRRPETVDLHETRICVKRLRYTAELMRDTQVQSNLELIDSLAKMQERLGRWNDDLVAARMIAKIACKLSSLVEQPAWSARLLAYSANRVRSAEAARRAILEEWPSVDTALRRCLEAPAQNTTREATAMETSA